MLFRFYLNSFKKGELKYSPLVLLPVFLLAICMYPSYLVDKSGCYVFYNLTELNASLYFYYSSLKYFMFCYSIDVGAFYKSIGILIGLNLFDLAKVYKLMLLK